MNIIIQVMKIIMDAVHIVLMKDIKILKPTVGIRFLRTCMRLVTEGGNDCSEREKGIIVPEQGNT